MEENKDTLVSFALLQGEPICVVNKENKIISAENLIHGDSSHNANLEKEKKNE